MNEKIHFLEDGYYVEELEEENKRLNNIIDKREQFLGDKI